MSKIDAEQARLELNYAEPIRVVHGTKYDLLATVRVSTRVDLGASAIDEKTMQALHIALAKEVGIDLRFIGRTDGYGAATGYAYEITTRWKVEDRVFEEKLAEAFKKVNAMTPDEFNDFLKRAEQIRDSLEAGKAAGRPMKTAGVADPISVDSESKTTSTVGEGGGGRSVF